MLRTLKRSFAFLFFVSLLSPPLPAELLFERTHDAPLWRTQDKATGLILYSARKPTPLLDHGFSRSTGSLGSFSPFKTMASRATIVRALRKDPILRLDFVLGFTHEYPAVDRLLFMENGIRLGEFPLKVTSGTFDISLGKTPLFYILSGVRLQENGILEGGAELAEFLVKLKNKKRIRYGFSGEGIPDSKPFLGHELKKDELEVLVQIGEYYLAHFD